MEIRLSLNQLENFLLSQVPFFSALRRYVSFLRGETSEPHEEEIVFANVVLKNWSRKKKVKEEPKEDDSGS